MHFEDLSPYTYADRGGSKNMVNVGWLSADYPFEHGPTPKLLIEMLRFLAEYPVKVTVTRKVHVCDLCESRGLIHQFCSKLGLLPKNSGSGEIHLCGANGTIYAAPVLIAHYIGSHEYRPPQPFIDAVIRV